MNAQNFSTNSDPILRITGVEKEVGLKKSTIYKLIKQNEFPQPISLGARASGWLLSEINQWKQNRIALSRGNDKC
ncbi:helix-turn-helix transcriptional regulator [Paraglaciecola sp.]|uniref:helix-turn-helix transcriptional regulator n=1 Tax=Paraglaciecola sp. TaxID=1920173 RepID=UPI003EF7366E